METTASAKEPLLELKGIGKDFGAVRALHDVDLKIYPGEVVGIMGDNGAGKSTLVKIVAGNFPATHGEIRFEGKPVQFRHPIDARDVGIEIVYQDLALADNLTATANVYLARELKRKFGPFSLPRPQEDGEPRAGDFCRAALRDAGRSTWSSKCREASARPSPLRAPGWRTPS